MHRRAALQIALLAAARQAGAQDAATWPTRPVTILVPYVPGGPSDLLARGLAPALQAAIGQSVVVENRPGGNGTVAALATARAVPDGHTLFIGASGILTVNPLLAARPAYDPVRDFAPVTLAISAPNLLVVHPAVPARSVAELIAWLRANPRDGAYGSSGIGSSEHLGMVMFGQATGTEVTHVPYPGSAAAVTDLVAGTLKLSLLNIGTVAPQVRAGSLRAIAIAGLGRHALLPDVPTLDTSGLPGFRSDSWHSIVAPAATPEPVLVRLHAAIAQALRDPAVTARLEQIGFTVEATDRATLAARIAADLARWRDVLRTAGIGAT